MANKAPEHKSEDPLLSLFFKGQVLNLDEMRAIWGKGIPTNANPNCFDGWKAVGRVLYDESSPEYNARVLKAEATRIDRDARSNPVYVC